MVSDYQSVYHDFRKMVIEADLYRKMGSLMRYCLVFFCIIKQLGKKMGDRRHVNCARIYKLMGYVKYYYKQ